ncbi:MAG: Zuotin [Sporothrix epigloea]
MAAATTLIADRYFPSLPAGWAAEGDVKRFKSLSAGTHRSLEPVGPQYLAHARRMRHNRTFSEDDRIEAEARAKKVDNGDDDGDISEPEDPSMLTREAKDWKSQDHYAILGLSRYRWKASEEQIKKAHRKKVLKHHPDKKAAAGGTEDDQFFKCIQKATEVLLDPIRRRQFDSVDEEAEVEPPTKKQLAAGGKAGDFYKLWSRCFKAEARFSRIQPVPPFGNEQSDKETVEGFYNFWYNFDSWRSFEYLDEDVPDDNENRDQKRHMERKNMNARKKKKAEDNARLRRLLDEASAGDERIKRFRQEANAAKNKKRLDKEAAELAAKEQAARAKAEAEQAAKAAEENAKADRESAKKAKEAAKNAVKKNKRVLKGSVKDANYFAAAGSAADAATIDKVLGAVERVQGQLDPTEIADLAGRLNGLTVADEIKSVWNNEVARLVGAGKVKEAEVAALA